MGVYETNFFLLYQLCIRLFYRVLDESETLLRFTRRVIYGSGRYRSEICGDFLRLRASLVADKCDCGNRIDVCTGIGNNEQRRERRSSTSIDVLRTVGVGLRENAERQVGTEEDAFHRYEEKF